MAYSMMVQQFVCSSKALALLLFVCFTYSTPGAAEVQTNIEVEQLPRRIPRRSEVQYVDVQEELAAVKQELATSQVQVQMLQGRLEECRLQNQQSSSVGGGRGAGTSWTEEEADKLGSGEMLLTALQRLVGSVILPLLLGGLCYVLLQLRIPIERKGKMEDTSKVDSASLSHQCTPSSEGTKEEACVSACSMGPLEDEQGSESGAEPDGAMPVPPTVEVPPPDAVPVVEEEDPNGCFGLDDECEREQLEVPSPLFLSSQRKADILAMLAPPPGLLPPPPGLPPPPPGLTLQPGSLAWRMQLKPEEHCAKEEQEEQQLLDSQEHEHHEWQVEEHQQEIQREMEVEGNNAEDVKQDMAKEVKQDMAEEMQQETVEETVQQQQEKVQVKKQEKKQQKKQQKQQEQHEQKPKQRHPMPLPQPQIPTAKEECHEESAVLSKSEVSTPTGAQEQPDLSPVTTVKTAKVVAPPGRRGVKPVRKQPLAVPRRQLAVKKWTGLPKLPCSWPIMVCLTLMLLVCLGSKCDTEFSFVLDVDLPWFFPQFLDWGSRSSKTGQNACSLKPLSYIKILNETEEPELPDDDKPIIMLKAPCMLTSFEYAARKYRPTGHWHYRPAENVKIEMKHNHETPIGMRNKIRNNVTIINFLQDNILPTFGRMTDVTYEWYLTQDLGLVWALLDTDEAVAEMRPAMIQVAKRFHRTHLATYVETAKNKEWLASEFGITKFPAIMVQRVGGGRHHVYRGAMSASAIGQFVEGVHEGCLGYEPYSSFGWNRKKESATRKPMCNALTSEQ